MINCENIFIIIFLAFKMLNYQIYQILVKAYIDTLFNYQYIFI